MNFIYFRCEPVRCGQRLEAAVAPAEGGTVNGGPATRPPAMFFSGIEPIIFQFNPWYPFKVPWFNPNEAKFADLNQL